MADEGLEKLIAAQRLSDAVYDTFLNQLGSSMEQAEVASHDPTIMKNFSMSAGGAVLRFQSKPVMHHDKGAPIKEFLKAVGRDFLLPTAAPDPIKALEIPPETLQAAKLGNITAQGALFNLIHAGKPKSAEAESRAQVAALIAGTANESVDIDLIPDDATRRAARAAEVQHANNPWANTSANCDASGRYTANALSRQAALVKANLAGAAGIAASVGSKIGDTRAQRKVA